MGVDGSDVTSLSALSSVRALLLPAADFVAAVVLYQWVSQWLGVLLAVVGVLLVGSLCLQALRVVGALPFDDPR
jgi:hypothetical protein